MKYILLTICLFCIMVVGVGCAYEHGDTVDIIKLSQMPERQLIEQIDNIYEESNEHGSGYSGWLKIIILQNELQRRFGK